MISTQLFVTYSQSELFVIEMELKELRDIVISAVALAFVFVYQGFDNLEASIALLPFGILTVSTSFVLHELGHRAFARKYNFHAEYKMWPRGLMLALLLAIASNGSFAFAAPGAVMIMPRADLWGRFRPMSIKAYGIISGVGPLINIILAVGFLTAAIVLNASILLFGASVNAWLAIFNMLPFGPLDGTKVLAWDKRIWLALMAGAVAMFALVQII